MSDDDEILSHSIKKLLLAYQVKKESSFLKMMEYKNEIINLKLTKVQVLAKSFLRFKYTAMSGHLKIRKSLLK